MKYRYILEPYAGMQSRYKCPGCESREKTFTRYIDTETGNYLDDAVGRCNRLDNCGYHATPKQFFQDGGIVPEDYKSKIVKIGRKPISYISQDIFIGSLNNYDNNNLSKYMDDLLGPDVAGDIITRYYLGSANYWPGSTVFWEVDLQGMIRAGKIMLYNPDTGRRVKEPFNHITWVHKALKLDDFELGQCFFGEHLLRDKSKPVAIVESEKTAMIASAYLPKFIWLATGSKEGINDEKCKVLEGREVKLFPDLNSFDKWEIKASYYHFDISSLLERKATSEEREKGLDLADFLIKFKMEEFI